MAIEMIMPKVDMDQETGTVVEWLCGNGESVRKGDVILVIETDKVAVDVESPGTGILSGIIARPGDVIPIGTVIAHILTEAEAGGIPALAAPASAAASVSAPAATPVARNMAEAHGLNLAEIANSGKGQKVTKADVLAELNTATAPVVASSAAPGKVNAVPAARRLALERQVTLSGVTGSGPGGRIQSVDVPALPASAQLPVSALPLAAPAPEPPAMTTPLIGMRRKIAERMTANYQAVPHIHFTARVLMDEFNAARAGLNAHAQKSGGEKISATALIVKLAAAVLQRHPQLNSSLDGEQIVLHPRINIGVAVALDGGLIVPVVHNADCKGLAQIANELNDLAARARQGKLIPAEVKGGTFTISNLGPFGIEQFDAIINAPEAGILAVGSTQMEAVPDPDGNLRARPVMRMTLSADHRIVDGAVAAAFLADLKACLEAPILCVY